MSTGTPAKKPVTELATLLDQAIANAPLNVVAQSIEKTLGTHIDKFRDTLPSQLKPEAERFVRRAIVYFQTAEPRTKLHQCTPQSFVMCVLEAAEIGLPLDGRLCHAVVYNNKKQDAQGRDIWALEATCMPDWKGLVAVAKRNNTIRDIYAEIVCENDLFEFFRTESSDTLKHTYEMFGDRGRVVGCYAKVQLPSGSWRFEILRRSDIDEIRAKSKAVNGGPWKDEESSDWKEMAKKTAIKRVLKGFMDDPGLARAIEIDDEATGYRPEHLDNQQNDGLTSTQRLTKRLADNSPERTEHAHTASEQPQTTQEPSKEPETRQESTETPQKEAGREPEGANCLADNLSRRIHLATAEKDLAHLAKEVGESFADKGLTQHEADALSGLIAEKMPK